jgi:hypothetical protein
LAIRIELVEEEDEEFVEELADRCRVVLLTHVLLSDHVQVVFKEGVCFDHAEDSRVGIAALTVAVVGAAPLLALQLFDGHRVVNRLGLLRAKLAFL